MSVLAAITLSLSEAGEPPSPFSVDRRLEHQHFYSVFVFLTWNGLKSSSLTRISGIVMDKSELTLTGEEVDLSKYIEDAGGIHGLRDVDKVRGWNNIEYGPGLSGKNTPSTALSMNKAFIPPGGMVPPTQESPQSAGNGPERACPSGRPKTRPGTIPPGGMVRV